VLSQERICSLAYGTPKLIFGELFCSKPFGEQVIEFFRCSREICHGALFNRRQGLDNLLNRHRGRGRLEAGAPVPA
jgi:hypothetical protein